MRFKTSQQFCFSWVGGRPWVLEIELETFVVTCMLDGNGRHRPLNPTTVLVFYVQDEEEEEAVALQWKT